MWWKKKDWRRRNKKKWGTAALTRGAHRIKMQLRSQAASKLGTQAKGSHLTQTKKKDYYKNHSKTSFCWSKGRTSVRKETWRIAAPIITYSRSKGKGKKERLLKDAKRRHKTPWSHDTKNETKPERKKKIGHRDIFASTAPINLKKKKSLTIGRGSTAHKRVRRIVHMFHKCTCILKNGKKKQ